MKRLIIIPLLCMFCASCERSSEGSGTLVIKGVKDINSVTAISQNNVPVLRNTQDNVHLMCSVDALFNIAEIWVCRNLSLKVLMTTLSGTKLEKTTV